MKFGPNMDVDDPRSIPQIKAMVKGHQVINLIVQSLIHCLAGHMVKFKGHMGQG